MASPVVAAKLEPKKNSAKAAHDDGDALQWKQATGAPAGLPRFLSGVTTAGDAAGAMRPEPVPSDATLPPDQAQSEAEDSKTGGAKPASGPLPPVRAAPAAGAEQRDGAAGRRTPASPPGVGGAGTARAAAPAARTSVPAAHGKAPGGGEAAPKPISAREAIGPDVRPLDMEARMRELPTVFIQPNRDDWVCAPLAASRRVQPLCVEHVRGRRSGAPLDPR